MGRNNNPSTEVLGSIAKTVCTAPIGPNFGETKVPKKPGSVPNRVSSNMIQDESKDWKIGGDLPELDLSCLAKYSRAASEPNALLNSIRYNKADRPYYHYSSHGSFTSTGRMNTVNTFKNTARTLHIDPDGTVTILSDQIQHTPFGVLTEFIRSSSPHIGIEPEVIAEGILSYRDSRIETEEIDAFEEAEIRLDRFLAEWGGMTEPMREAILKKASEL